MHSEYVVVVEDPLALTSEELYHRLGTGHDDMEGLANWVPGRMKVADARSSNSTRWEGRIGQGVVDCADTDCKAAQRFDCWLVAAQQLARWMMG